MKAKGVKFLGQDVVIDNMVLIDWLATQNATELNFNNLPVRKSMELIHFANPAITIQMMESAIKEDLGFVSEISETVTKNLKIKNS